MPGRIKALIVAVFALAGILGSSAVALAGWCWSDPIIDVSAVGIETQRVNIIVGIQEEDLHRLDGAVDVIIKLPANVEAEVVYMDNIIPENVIFKQSNQLWHPASGSIPLEVGIFARSKDIQFPVAVLIEQQGPWGSGPQITEGVSGAMLNAAYQINVPPAIVWDFGGPLETE